jgi:hypothetical protein
MIDQLFRLPYVLPARSRWRVAVGWLANLPALMVGTNVIGTRTNAQEGSRLIFMTGGRFPITAFLLTLGKRIRRRLLFLFTNPAPKAV